MTRFHVPRPSALLAAFGATLLTFALGGGSAMGLDALQDAEGIMTQLESGLSRKQLCDARFLRHLGWTYGRDASVRRVTVFGGTPCRHRTLEQARRAGDLRILFPTDLSAEQVKAFGAEVASIALGAASRCAYQLKIAVATRKATNKIAAITESGRYVFPELLDLVHSPWFSMRLPQPDWELRDQLWTGATTPSKAIESIYRRGAAVECYVGQAISIYALQYELYGPNWFDEAFVASDLQVGRPADIKVSPVGQYTRYDVKYPWTGLLIDEAHRKQDPILRLAAFGPTAFAGLSGVIRSQQKDVNINDNLLIVSISDRALRDLVEGGGYPYIQKRAKELYEHRDAGCGVFVSRRKQLESKQQVDAILALPVFSETIVYCHPYGVVPLADVVRKKTDQADTPMELLLYLHGREDHLFRRYRRAFWLRCFKRYGVQPEAETAVRR